MVVHPVEQQVADDRRDVDRRRAQEDAAAAELDEVDVVGIVGARQELHVALSSAARRP